MGLSHYFIVVYETLYTLSDPLVMSETSEICFTTREAALEHAERIMQDSEVGLATVRKVYSVGE